MRCSCFKCTHTDLYSLNIESLHIQHFDKYTTCTVCQLDSRVVCCAVAAHFRPRPIIDTVFAFHIQQSLPSPPTQIRTETPTLSPSPNLVLPLQPAAQLPCLGAEPVVAPKLQLDPLVSTNQSRCFVNESEHRPELRDDTGGVGQLSLQVRKRDAGRRCVGRRSGLEQQREFSQPERHLLLNIYAWRFAGAG